jgi:hypothetical protein
VRGEGRVWRCRTLQHRRLLQKEGKVAHGGAGKEAVFSCR